MDLKDRSLMRYFMFFILCFIALAGQAEIKLPAMFSSNMVLQRNAKVNIWGWATPGESIRIKASWLSKEKEVITTAKGRWELQLKTNYSKQEQSIAIHGDGSNLQLDHILFGEVWLCSGQSNMAWRVVQPLKKTSKKINQADELIQTATGKSIRLFRVQGAAKLEPQDDLQGEWLQADPSTVPDFSAVAYSFAEHLEKTLDVPVGLIVSAVGGSKVEAWLNASSLEQFPEIDLPTQLGKKNNKLAGVLYNAMIKPLVGYTIKGAIWYQGEANRQNPELYQRLFPALIGQWRDEWDQKKFPFYFAQIAPYGYKDGQSTHIREVHFNTISKVKKTGMAVTLDVGEEKNIHPNQKRIVGQRLALWALAQNYGQKNMAYSGPLYKSYKIKDDHIIVKFDHAHSGLELKGNETSCFEVAGSDRKFYPAQTTINPNHTIAVYSDKVQKPVAVRYAFTDWVKGILYNKEGLPASSFRTDKW